jgi:hypothetical protein
MSLKNSDKGFSSKVMVTEEIEFYLNPVLPLPLISILLGLSLLPTTTYFTNILSSEYPFFIPLFLADSNTAFTMGPPFLMQFSITTNASNKCFPFIRSAAAASLWEL